MLPTCTRAARPGETMIQLVTRGDDVGMCESANRGVLSAIREGCVRNISVMATGPTLAHAASLLAHEPGICVGLHVALNCEWVAPRWGNVLPASQVPSLCKPDGSQWETPHDLQRQGVVVEQAMAEVAAQLARVRAAGFTVTYLDEHMGVGWIGLRAPLAEFCRREGLIDAATIGSPLPGEGTYPERLAQQTAGTYVMIGHPCLPEPELDHFILPGQQPGDTTRDRDVQRRWFSDPALLALIAAGRVTPVSYAQAA
jgi:hypothetical protein